LHTFTSEADPRAVQALGGQLENDAGAVGGVLGGFAGSAVGNRAADKLGMPEDPTRATRVEETAGEAGAKVGSTHPEGPTVEAVPGPGAVPIAGAEPAGPRPGTDLPPSERPALPPPEQRLVLTPEEFAALDARRANPNGSVIDTGGTVVAGGPLPGGTVTTTPGLVGPDNRPLRPSGSMDTVYGPGGEVANRSVIINPDHVDPADVTYIPAPPGSGSANAYEPTIAQVIVPGYLPDPNNATARPVTRFDPQPTYGEFRAALNRAGDANVPRNLIIDPSNPPPAPQLGYGYGRIYDANGDIVPDRFGDFRGEVGQPIRDPATGQVSWDPDARLDTPYLPRPGYGPDPLAIGYGVRTGEPGAWIDHSPLAYGPAPNQRDIANADDPAAALAAFRARANAEGRAAAEAHARAEAAYGPQGINNRRALPTAWPLPYNRKPGALPQDTNFGRGMDVYEVPNPPFAISSVTAPI